MNGHVGRGDVGFKGAHVGHGYGERNKEVEMLLEFAEADELVITNTFFQKEDVKKITYMSGGAKTTIDFLLVRKKDRQLVKDVKVIPSEECVTVTQH